MRVLIVTGKMESGGAETHVYSLVRGLTERGHRVCLASAGGRLARALCEQGVPHLRVPLDTKNPLRLLIAKRRLSQFIKQYRPHVIHAHTRLAAYVACKIGREQGICTITTAHARFSMGAFKGTMSRWGEWVIAVSQDLRQHLLQSPTELPAERICVIPNGIDTQKFAPSEGPYAEKIKNIVFVSRLDADCSSAAYSLCNIARQLDAALGGITITICGGGTQLRAIRKRARAINAEVGREIVRAIGSSEHVEELLRDADVFVGVSRAALEAMSCAVPVILAGDEGFLGAIDEIDLERAEHTNFCCRGEDKLTDGALLSAICKLAEVRGRERIGKALREYVCRYHSSSICAERTEKVYRRALAGAPCRACTGQILLCGYYGYGNMGDDALLIRAIERARNKYPRLSICALTAGGKRDGRKFCVRCAARTSPAAVRREIKKSEIVVFGGGTLLQNDTSMRSLWYYLWVLRLAKKYGKRVQLWANGIGQIRGKRARNATARALCGCELLGLRDRESVALARRLLSESKLSIPRMILESDLALAEYCEDSERTRYLLDMLGIGEGARIAVVALRGVERAGYVHIMRRWVLSLAREGILPVFAVMFADEDLDMSIRICREVGGVLAYPIGIGDTVSLMRRACVVLGMRYHALVFASGAGVPFIGFGAQPKIESFCRAGGGIYFLDMLAQERGEAPAT